MLSELGFQLATLPEGKTETKQGKRQDIVQISGENMADSLNGKSLLLFSADDSLIREVMANPFLSHLEPVINHHIWAMGTDTFRLDYYSASNMLGNIERYFAKSRLPPRLSVGAITAIRGAVNGRSGLAGWFCVRVGRWPVRFVQ